jgi:hypothetical protein
MKTARVKELNEVLQQIERTKKSLEGSKVKSDTDFADAYNMGLQHAIHMINIDIMTIETKIKLIEYEKI